MKSKQRTVRKKTHGIVSAGNKYTAEAAIQMFEAGGNAFDAALAAMTASCIAEASLTSLGGGGFLMAHSQQTGESILFDFFAQTPLKRQPLEEVDFVKTEIDFGTTIQLQYGGKGSVAIPGVPAGLFHVHKRLGSLPIMEVVAPSLQIAREGFVLNAFQEYAFAILSSVLLHSPETRDVYCIDGRLLKGGDVMKVPQWADAVEAMALSGGREFYEGEIGQRFARDNRESGGSVTLEDLKKYRVIERKPLIYPYKGYEFITNPPPSAGGSMISFGLASLSRHQLQAPYTNPQRYIRKMAEVMRLMEEMRALRLNDYLHAKDPLKAAFDELFVASACERVHAVGNTTHISVMDEFGNAATVTTTLGGGSGHIIPGTGIISNNMLGEIDLNPDGFYKWAENQRVTSMMAPSIVLKDGMPRYGLGSGGSSRIRTAILQVLVNMIDLGMSVEEAVAAPRLHWEANELNIEPGLLKGGTMTMEGTKVQEWDEMNMYYGGVHTVGRRADGTLEGCGDPRRNGVVFIC